MKVLFISSNLASSLHGGWQCSARNLSSLKKICGEDQVDVELLAPYMLKDKLWKEKINSIFSACFRLFFTCRMNGATLSREHSLIGRVKKNNYDYVFVDSSLNGFLVKKIKRNTTSKVIVFFHNCELSFVRSHLLSGNLFAFFRLLPCYLNEKKSVVYADKVVVLNERDQKLVSTLYKRNSSFYIIPISLKDIHPGTSTETSFSNASLLSPNEKIKPTALFVGSNFYANRKGIEWFIHHVLPAVDIRLLIVGKEMDKLKIPADNKIFLYGTVPSLSEYYFKADFVIAPLFSGGGMKVKIAEALMYDKPVIGTPEAFEGYESSSSLICCRTKNDFIKAISRISGDHLGESRKLFLRKYSFEATLRNFEELLRC